MLKNVILSGLLLFAPMNSQFATTDNVITLKEQTIQEENKEEMTQSEMLGKIVSMFSQWWNEIACIEIFATLLNTIFIATVFALHFKNKNEKDKLAEEISSLKELISELKIKEKE